MSQIATELTLTLSANIEEVTQGGRYYHEINKKQD